MKYIFNFRHFFATFSPLWFIFHFFVINFFRHFFAIISTFLGFATFYPFAMISPLFRHFFNHFFENPKKMLDLAKKCRKSGEKVANIFFSVICSKTRISVVYVKKITFVIFCDFFICFLHQIIIFNIWYNYGISVITHWKC